MALTRDERDALIKRAIDADDRRFGDPEPSEDEDERLSEAYYASVADYLDGLPRVVMSTCPFCGEPFLHSFDPWGLDGIWWGEDDVCQYSEPPPCEHFRVLLGAVRIEDSAIPPRTMMRCIPGPEVPFVVPRLLSLPHMVAVVGKLDMERAGPAYPVVYFSRDPIDAALLHHEWRRSVYWFQKDGQDVWQAVNDEWDFDLDPYVARDALLWVLLDPDEPRPPLHRASLGESCPFVNLQGERLPQEVEDGERAFLDLPDGSALNPFEEDGGG